MAETPAEDGREETPPRTMETTPLPRPRRGEVPLADVMGRPNSPADDVMGNREPIPEKVFGERPLHSAPEQG